MSVHCLAHWTLIKDTFKSNGSCVETDKNGAAEPFLCCAIIRVVSATSAEEPTGEFPVAGSLNLTVFLGMRVNHFARAVEKETKMIRLVKSAILGMAVAATTLTAIPAANAGNNWNRYYGNYHGSNGDAIAAGILGLAAGAIIGGILAQPTYRSPVYADPYRYQNLGPVGSYYANGYYQEPVYARRSLQPLSRGWYNYCRSRYRTFNPRTGTFFGYDGRVHFCTAG